VAGYTDLLVWQRGMDLVEDIYAFTKSLPTDERYAMCSQLQRAAVSIPSNLAEGHSRRTSGSYMHHVSIALGSQAELETLLELCSRLNLGVAEQRLRCLECTTETGRMLYGLHRSLERARRQRGLLYSMILLVPGILYVVSSSTRGF
jgi:four helix bundle protein